MELGVLALQGAFIEHIRRLAELQVASREVRLPQDLEGLAGLILPGGESTAIAKLMAACGLVEPIRRFAARHAVWGTCAGMILLAKDVGRDPPVLGLMDMTVARNAFGRQIDSFEVPLAVDGLEEGSTRLFPGIFIRAPRLAAVRPPAQVIARLADGTGVAARQGRLLATAFHPELSGDLRFHRYFIEMVGS
ncbi:MAG: pyridoxal 5'-phosphate synthase glutaminase subunit PdxT [Desulfobacterales bacterium]